MFKLYELKPEYDESCDDWSNHALFIYNIIDDTYSFYKLGIDKLEDFFEYDIHDSDDNDEYGMFNMSTYYKYHDELPTEEDLLQSFNTIEEVENYIKMFELVN